MSSVTDITREAFLVEQRGFDWLSGIAGALAAVGPLAIGIAVGEPAAGFTAAIGGLNTALCVPRAELRSRLWWGGLAAAGGTASLAVADTVDGATWSLVLVTLVWVASWSLWRAAGPPGALLGFATAAVFVIMAGLPADPVPLGRQLLWFAMGALPGYALMVLARHGPPQAIQNGVARDALHAYAHALRADTQLRAHAARLAVAVALGTLLYRVVGLPHGYWVALTTLAILQPSEHGTHVRVIQRAAGTLGGAAVILVITLATDERWLLLGCAAASAGALYALDRRSYFWLVVLLTPTVLFMLSAVSFEGDDVALERVANSSLGIVVGLAIGEAAWRLSARR